MISDSTRRELKGKAMDSISKPVSNHKTSRVNFTSPIDAHDLESVQNKKYNVAQLALKHLYSIIMRDLIELKKDDERPDSEMLEVDLVIMSTDEYMNLIRRANK